MRESQTTLYAVVKTTDCLIANVRAKKQKRHVQRLAPQGAFNQLKG